MYLAVDGQEVSVQLTGKLNVSNLLTVYGAARMLGKQREEIPIVTSTLYTANGYMDTLRSSEGSTAIVDYVRTPDVLKNVLLAIHKVNGKGYIITVCDADGNRDKDERPLMAKQTV